MGREYYGISVALEYSREADLQVTPHDFVEVCYDRLGKAERAEWPLPYAMMQGACGPFHASTKSSCRHPHSASIFPLSDTYRPSKN